MTERVLVQHSKEMGRGLMLLLDGQTGLQKLSRKWLRKFLEESVEVVQMQKISEPVVAVWPNGKHARGQVLLAESHIEIHWDYPYLLLDLYSCKEFRVEEVVLWIADQWEGIQGSYTIIRRGWGWSVEELGVWYKAKTPEVQTYHHQRV